MSKSEIGGSQTFIRYVDRGASRGMIVLSERAERLEGVMYDICGGDFQPLTSRHPRTMIFHQRSFDATTAAARRDEMFEVIASEFEAGLLRSSLERAPIETWHRAPSI